MDVHEQEYLKLTQRMGELAQKRAVLVDREAEKAKERTRLEGELKALGVDPTHPKEEEERLTRELEGLLKQQREELDQFEKQLNLSLGPDEPIPTADRNQDPDLDI